MGSLYRFRQISDNNAFPYPESITWKTFYQIEGPVFLPKTAIYVLDGKGLTFTFTQSDEDTFWIWVLGFMQLILERPSGKHGDLMSFFYTHSAYDIYIYKYIYRYKILENKALLCNPT